MKMVEPGGIIDAVGNLQEQHEILRAQIQFSFRTTKVEAAVFRQCALGVLSLVTFSIELTGCDAHRKRILADARVPYQGLPGRQGGRRQWPQRFPSPFTEQTQCLGWILS